MPKLHRQVVLSTILLLASLPVLAASGVELSIYQSRNEAGFRSASNGLAIVHEHRDVMLKAGPQALTLDGFPPHFDPRSLLLHFSGSAAAQIDRLQVISAGKRSNLLGAAIGQKELANTARKQQRTLDLGRAFELRGQRQRTRWAIQGQQLTEGLRLTLYNAASHARTVWITQYPNRWRVWTLLQASPQPVQHDASRLSWKVRIPAQGKTHIHYTIRYYGDRS